MWTRRVPGGLAVGTVIMCVIFAATSGVVGATETVVGLLAIPAMLKYNYSKSLISRHHHRAGGSLGTIIPPSVLAVVIGPVANASVGNILLGMFIPGFMLAISYIIYIVILCSVRPEYGPASQRRPMSPHSAPSWY
jgi:TRAP-type mannitol/chloroaromatic compound transport system permease large subunit